MKRLVVYDLSNFIFRAFFAIRSLNAPDGTPVNAVYGVLNMIINSLEELSPTHMLIAQDNKGGSFRNKLYDEYKANRSAPPEELVPQFDIIDQLIDKLRIPKLRLDDLEADDVIGSAIHKFRDDFDEILIASSDKDLMQFVCGKVKMVDTMRGKVYGREEVLQKMGVYPEQIRDYLSLVGDSSDNIPGVKGIGAKGAAKLLGQYQTLEGVFENIDKITNKRVLNGLQNYREDAFLSKELVTIKCDGEITATEKDLKYTLSPQDDLKEFLIGLNFKSVLKKLYDKVDVLNSNKELKKNSNEKEDTSYQIEREGKAVFVRLQFEKFIDSMSKNTSLALILEGFNWSIATPTVSFNYSSRNESVFKEDFSLFMSKGFRVYSFKPKDLYKTAWNHSIPLDNKIFDISMAHFNIDPAKKHTEQFLVEDELETSFDEDDFNKRSRCLLELGNRFLQKLEESDLKKIYEDIDLKINPILAEMEYMGVYLDKKELEKLEKEYSEKLEEIETEILKIADMEVNLKSPKQVSGMLFEKLGLPVIKKTKTGASTDASVLQKLASMDESPVPGLLLQYREIDKLLSTYIKVLPGLISEQTGRLHTTFNQDVAATGRLSSDKPNLQNIPIKTEMGRRIRKAFIADKGFTLLAADYSQVELRILAHFCEDEVMMNAFKNGIDIHAQTASEVFGVPLKDMTPEVRSRAKAINFGLIYGQSSFGLSETLGISRTEAKEYITHYFHRFGRVKAFLDSLKEDCEKTGFAKTMFGRKRPVPDINSKNRTMKSFAERVAINSPIQGTAADIIKIAMINISKIIDEQFEESRMILQVHDELIFEAHKNEVEKLKRVVVREMESAVELKVPLKVDVGIGADWYSLK